MERVPISAMIAAKPVPLAAPEGNHNQAFDAFARSLNPSFSRAHIWTHIVALSPIRDATA